MLDQPLSYDPGVPPERQRAWERERKRQSSQRSAVEPTIPQLKWWRVLQRFTGRRATEAPAERRVVSTGTARRPRRLWRAHGVGEATARGAGTALGRWAR